MTFNNFSLYLIRRLLIVILFFTTSQVNASVISYSDSFNTYVSASSTTDNHASNGDNDTDSIILKGFDASLGMLSSVSLSFESTWNFNALIYAEDPTPYTYLDNFGFTHTTNDTMGTLYFPFIDFQVALIDQSSIPIASTSLYNSFFSLGCEAEYIGGPDYFVSCLGDYHSGIGPFYNDTLDLSGIDLNTFIKAAGDTFDLRFQQFLGFDVFCDNNDGGDVCTGNADSNWNGSATISYTYNKNSHVVPEPSSFLLLVSGLALLGFTRRKIN